eukprot:3491976-Lingulodinium_polyedra.AAC.1
MGHGTRHLGIPRARMVVGGHCVCVWRPRRVFVRTAARGGAGGPRDLSALFCPAMRRCAIARRQ